MGLFLRLFGPRKIPYFKAMVEMADEFERTYRGMIGAYSLGVRDGLLANCTSTCPNQRGLYKARFLGSLFMVRAYIIAGATQDKYMEMLNVASGHARKLSFADDRDGTGSGRQIIDREIATEVFDDYVARTMKTMNDAFDAGPWQAPRTFAMDPQQFLEKSKKEHLALCECLHEALAESVPNYSPDVRERFDLPIAIDIALAMNHSMCWALGKRISTSEWHRR